MTLNFGRRRDVLATAGLIVGLLLAQSATAKDYQQSNLDGSISSWTGGNTAQVVVPPRGSTPHTALHTGLATGDVGGHTAYYAPNQITQTVDTYDAGFPLMAGAFVEVFRACNASAVLTNLTPGCGCGLSSSDFTPRHSRQSQGLASPGLESDL